MLLDKGTTLSSVLARGAKKDAQPNSDKQGEEVRSRLAFRVDGDGAGGCRLGPVTVTRERKYVKDFDDGLLYKGERGLASRGSFFCSPPPSGM